MKGKASLEGPAEAGTRFHWLCLDAMLVSLDLKWTLWPDYTVLVFR